MTGPVTLAAVVIGRNEGQRLVRCLASLAGQVDRIVYVDSGSTDGSVTAAEAAGAHAVHLDISVPFTAARARNAGLEALRVSGGVPEFVQFVDGDCEVDRDWPGVGMAFLRKSPSAAVVSGRTRERHPDATIWNYLMDCEWASPAGRVSACTGNAMFRVQAFDQVNGFDPRLIAGEEPELCLRLRRLGWEVWKLDAPMAVHDAAMTRFSQWWRRAQRAGHAAAEGAAMHGRGPERYNVMRAARPLVWTLGLPAVALVGALWSPLALVVLLAWPLKVLRLRWTGKSWTQAFFLMLGKLPETQGILAYWVSRLRGRRRRLIEYK
jgi:GT2 family glycosyltransferase